jgi:hypothetical protein
MLKSLRRTRQNKHGDRLHEFLQAQPHTTEQIDFGSHHAPLPSQFLDIIIPEQIILYPRMTNYPASVFFSLFLVEEKAAKT